MRCSLYGEGEGDLGERGGSTLAVFYYGRLIEVKGRGWKGARSFLPHNKKGAGRRADFSSVIWREGARHPLLPHTLLLHYSV